MDRTGLDNAEKAYQNDPHYRQLVDVLYAQIIELQLSPAEIRSAAMLAAIHVEQHTLRSSFVERTY